MTHHDRILSAYPGLLPGFFTLADDTLCPAGPVPVRRAWHDPSEAPPGRIRRRGPRRALLAHRRLFEAYRDACMRAVAALFAHGDAVLAGEAIIVTCAMSAADFDRLAALGSELEDLENDDPGEDADPPEWSDAEETDFFPTMCGGQS